MDYSSASEGEIIESAEETKATTTRPSSRDGDVNRSDRPRSLVSRLARPPQSDGTYDEEDDANLNYDDGSRPTGRTGGTQRGGPNVPRGQKRGHPDDHSTVRGAPDTRQFKVHYEGGRDSASHGSRRDRGGQDDYRDSHGGHNGRTNPDRQRSDDTYGRRRRPDDTKREGGPKGLGSRRQDREDGHYGGQRAVDRRDHDDYDVRSRRSSTAASGNQESTQRPVHRDHDDAEKRGSVRQRQHSPERGTTTADGVNGGSKPPNEVSADEVTTVEAVDEATLIEERRRRREALRAKHKTQETPLLHKALHVGPISQLPTSMTDTNNNESSREASPAPSSPSTPHPGSSPGSPAVVTINDDSELANSAQNPTTDDAGDGPSAADYDPSMDMPEIRLREQHTVRDMDSAAVAYDETKDEDRVVPVPTAATGRSEPQQSAEFDMFAEDEDDEDDMFAPADAKTGHRKDAGMQAVRIPEAKQLDRSLLDDWDDPEGYYRIILGELLDGRYHVQTNLGKGVFSAVVRAQDTKTDKLVAIKVIRKQESMYKAGMKEIEILQQLAEADPEDKKHVIRLERHFEHKGHLCMVFENLSINLREVLKKFGRDVGINIKAVRSYAQQIFLGLSLLKKCELLHADLKPDNILVNEARSQLKIADLGSAIPAEDNEITDVLVSRFYRAPEIMLGIKGDYAMDMWSIGCTLFEMYTGKICFAGPSNNQMLKAIMECRGKIPNRIIKKSQYWPQHFDADGTFLSEEIDVVTRKDVMRRINITRTVPARELRTRLFANTKGLTPIEAKELNLFVDLLDKCLQVDPSRRITPNEALKHGFINRSSISNK